MRYQRGAGPLAKVHDSFALEGRSYDFEALATADYSPQVRSRGQRSFVLRALDEQRSLLAFSELLAEMAEAGAGIDVIGSLTRVVRDEARHVDLCQQVVQALGGWPAEAPEANWVRSDRTLPLRERIMRTVVGSLVLGETISVAMIAGVREHATDPVVHALLTDLLADESYHSRFGFYWLERHLPSMTTAERASLDRYLPGAFLGMMRVAMPSAAALRRDEPYDYGPFGAMSPRERSAAFRHSVERQILPGLEKLGVNARGAWTRAEERLTAPRPGGAA